MKISIAIPNYKRVNELKTCLNSILFQTTPPFEVVIHDDASPNQELVSDVVAEYACKFSELGVTVNFIAASQNIGYDGSLRKLISASQGDYILFIGNDDYLMPTCVFEYLAAIEKHQPLMISRNFNKFHDDPPKVFGVSRFTDHLKFFSSSSQVNFALRLCAYFGGLAFKRSWALALNTDQWDGTLYYQYYLALNAYSKQGILCIPTPTVAARADGLPLFGETDKTKVHIVGRYSVLAREKMWVDILKITKNHDVFNQTYYHPIILKELKVRMSFHLMEMFASSGKSDLIELAKSLRRLKLFWHPIPITLWTVNFVAGRKALTFYSLIRSLFQN
jgi:glycosyltransferase involved in cell wall biosynthesis